LKTLFIENFVEGQAVQEVFIVTEKTVSSKKDGDAFLQVRLTDRTGSIRGVIWDNVETLTAEFNCGDYVQIQGRVTSFRNESQLTILSVKQIQSDTINPSDFLPMTQRDPIQMFASLKEQSQTIENKELKTIIQAFWNDEAFVQKFCLAPAAKKMHHAYLGGLLEHTLSVARLVDRLIQCHYRGIDRDLLLAGAILHDIGKIDEFEYQTMIEYSNEGRLLNHIIIGLRLLDIKIASIPDFPEETANQLRHLIASHHGTRLFGSPEPPKTLEAIILHYLDDMDSKIMGVRDFMENSDETSEWTSFHYAMERQFYKGKQ